MPDQQPQQQSALAKKSLGYLTTSSRKVALSLGSKTVFGLLLIIAIGVSGWLLMTYAWLPLNQTGLLPAGVTKDNPALSTDLLQVINNKRVERSQYKATSYSAFGPLFEPSTTPTPTLVP